MPFLTLAWWTAKALGFKDAAARFLNGQTLAALGIAVALVAVLIGAVLLYGAGGSGAVAKWQSQLMTSRLVATLRERKAQREADARAATERQNLVELIRDQSQHAASLEQEIARLTENPVCFPQALTKELRK